MKSFKLMFVAPQFDRQSPIINKSQRKMIVITTHCKLYILKLKMSETFICQVIVVNHLDTKRDKVIVYLTTHYYLTLKLINID